MEMIEAGEVETIIVKDMFRPGRNYLYVSRLTEMYFPEKGVRYIAVNDNVDSLVAGSDDFNGIRNWFNEQHAKDTSKKVWAVKRIRAECGERLGGRPPYGYKKRSPDSKDIVLDEETTSIIQCVFRLCTEGKGPNQIARILTKEEILTPARYTYENTAWHT